MTDHLTPLDATFLELEQNDESAHMHIGGALVFDPRPGGSIPTVGEVCRHLDSRLGQLPRYRRRLSETRTGGLRWPTWEDDERFHLASHVRHATLPGPGSDEELCEWLGDYWSHRLDRHRPLWEVVLLDGLADGRWALVTKTHHAMVDGVGSVDVGYLMLDDAPDAPARPRSGPPPAEPEDEHRSSRSQLAGLLRWMPEHALRAARSGAGVALHPRKALEMAERSRAMVEEILRDEVRRAPASSLNCDMGATRTFAVVRVPLADMKHVKAALGGTVNDVALAAVTGGLRRMLQARGEALPPNGLRAMVPMNVRDASEKLALGNKVSSLFVHLPVAGATAADRYRAVKAEAEHQKSGTQAMGTSAIISLAGLAPPALHAGIARTLYATRLFNVTVTNVPGPQMTLYALGARLREILPLVPLAAEHAVGVAIFSYDGGVVFGINAATDAVPDLDVLRDGLAAEIQALRDLAAAAQPASV
ncbi:MAG TPA: wax ester/triacylglycerol synthase family O-acyltransferase [Solirubrobacterales bacterium]|nr:wax ester/triacylglycerol synthase family O-acyltransferase [Solirubrobacterales bacterium]